MSRFSVKQLVWGELVLWSQSEGWGPRGNSATCSALPRLSVTSPATHKQIEPFWCWFPGGWACVHTRTLRVSLTNSPVRLGVSPKCLNSHRCFQSVVFEALFPCWNPGLCSLSRSPVVPPGLSAWECGTTHSTIRHLSGSTSCYIAVSPFCLAAHLRPSYRSGWMFLL